MVDEKLRIAIISAHSCPVGDLGARDTGGMSVYIRELAHELGKQGHYVDVYTRVHDPNDPQIVDLGQQARLIHLKAGQEKNIHKLAIYCYLPEFTCNLENFRRNNGLGYDIIFSHYWLSGWVGEYLQHWWQVPNVVMFHTLGIVKNIVGIGEDAPDLRIVTERESVHKAQRIIAATEREKEELKQYYEANQDNIGVVPCGVNLEMFRPIERMEARQVLAMTDEEKVLIFVGRLDPLKGLDQLLKAVPYIDNNEKLKLIIIGGDERSQQEMDRLQILAADLGIQDLVTFQGLVKQEKLPYYYNAADICIVPSYYESFGLVALESLACGTPVVANDVGELKNIIRQGVTGYVVSDNSPYNLAEGINQLLSNISIGNEASLIRASIGKFSWSNVAEGVIRELRKVLDSRLVPTR